MDKEKIYFNSIFCKETRFGIRLSGKVDEIIKQLGDNTNEKGYINLEIKKRREPSDKGLTHYIEVDTYMNKSQDEKRANPVSRDEERLSDDSLPF